MTPPFFFPELGCLPIQIQEIFVTIEFNNGSKPGPVSDLTVGGIRPCSHGAL